MSCDSSLYSKDVISTYTVFCYILQMFSTPRMKRTTLLITAKSFLAMQQVLLMMKNKRKTFMKKYMSDAL